MHTASHLPRADRPTMHGYGLRQDEERLLPWSWAADRLLQSHNYWVATSGSDGRPHLAAVWGVWWQDQFVFSTGGRSAKARNLATDSRCSVAPEGAQESVVLHGVARRLIEPTDVESIRDVYVSKYGSGFPDENDNPLFAVRPHRVIAVIDREGQFTETATRFTFDR